MLIEHGADVNHDAGGKGTPLHRAAEAGNLPAARTLLEKGAHADAIDDAGRTPLVVALQHCSNATIERVAPVAELLLGEMTGRKEKPRSLISRIFGGAVKEASPITLQMQSLVTRIGTDFEFYRLDFDPESIDATTRSLERLYTLFDVSAVPRRAMHDGKSPIYAKAVAWEDRHEELWKLLVSSTGPAVTVQGEVIRISGRLSDEIERNGRTNWDVDYSKMADAFLAHINSAQPLSAPELAEARKVVSDLKGRGGQVARLRKKAVDWVALNPTPIRLRAPDYTR